MRRIAKRGLFVEGKDTSKRSEPIVTAKTDPGSAFAFRHVGNGRIYTFVIDEEGREWIFRGSARKTFFASPGFVVKATRAQTKGSRIYADGERVF